MLYNRNPEKNMQLCDGNLVSWVDEIIENEIISIYYNVRKI